MMIKNSIWARCVWKTESFIAHALCLLNVLCVCVPNNHPTERITTCARIANLHRIWQNMSRSIYTVLFGSIRTFHFFVISFNRSLSRSHVVSIVSKKPFFSNVHSSIVVSAVFDGLVYVQSAYNSSLKRIFKESLKVLQRSPTQWHITTFKDIGFTKIGSV